MRLNSHFKDGKGFISISTSMEEHLSVKDLPGPCDRPPFGNNASMVESLR